MASSYITTVLNFVKIDSLVQMLKVKMHTEIRIVF
jgi:hypothetical protein